MKTSPVRCLIKTSKPEGVPPEPLFFRPHLKNKIWGGERLRTMFGKDVASGSSVGESWELSAIENSPTTAAGGGFTGQPLDAIYSAAPAAIAGSMHAQFSVFPLLIKFIDAHDRLSVQVHPDDRFARERFGLPFGKTECWYIADTGKSGSIAVGFKENVSRSVLREAVASGRVEELLNIVPVKKGEVYFIPAGTVHSILSDVVVYEVQQSSDITLRLYDWMRVDGAGNPRPLHLDEAVAVADISGPKNYRIEPLTYPSGEYRHSVRVACKYFAVEEFLLEQVKSVSLNPRSSFRVLTFMQGEGELLWDKGRHAVYKGNTLLLPATMGIVSVHTAAGCSFLMTTVPALQHEIVQPLLEARFTPQQIACLGGD